MKHITDSVEHLRRTDLVAEPDLFWVTCTSLKLRCAIRGVVIYKLIIRQHENHVTTI